MIQDDKDKHIDEYSGIETTGHEWDGIRELNNPSPRWWVWVFIVTIVWAIGYWYVYPAWPTFSGDGFRGGTQGSINWTQYKQLEESQNEILSRRAENLEQFQKNSIEDVMKHPQLFAFAVAGGKSAFKENCAGCHGSGAAGARGYPNLNDDDWLWGGSIENIYLTIKHGIRTDNPKTRASSMPSFKGMQEDDLKQIAAYVMSLSKSWHYTAEGKTKYEQMCLFCHGKNGVGNPSLGAANISDSIWLHVEDSNPGIVSQIENPKHGVMPAWEGRLDDATIKQLAIYVHSLGGGE